MPCARQLRSEYFITDQNANRLMTLVFTTALLCLLLCYGVDVQLKSLKLLLDVIATDETSKVGDFAQWRRSMQTGLPPLTILSPQSSSCPRVSVIFAKVPAGIPPAPINPKMAGLLRMLAHCKLVLAFGRRSTLRRVRKLIGSIGCPRRANNATLPQLPAKGESEGTVWLERCAIAVGLGYRGAEGFDGKWRMPHATVGFGCLRLPFCRVSPDTNFFQGSANRLASLLLRIVSQRAACHVCLCRGPDIC